MKDQNQILNTGPSNSKMTRNFMREEFDVIINNSYVTEADANFTPDMFDETYLNM